MFVAHLEILFHILGVAITLFCLKLEFQGLSVMLMTDLIKFGVKNQALKVYFKILVGDSMSVSSYEFDDIIFFYFMDILKAISYYRAQEFTLHGPKPPPPSYLITCSSPHSASKDGDLLYSLGCFLLTFGGDFT